MQPGEMKRPELEVTRLDDSAQNSSKPTGAARWLCTQTGRATISVVCALLVVGALVGLTMRATPDPAGAFTAAFGLPTATPTAPILFGGDTFIISDTVPWGSLTVDGRSPALTDVGDLGTGFALKRGVHHLVYQARDFPTLRCVISVPASKRDTCPMATGAPQAVSASFQRFLDLQTNPAHLLPSAYASLVAAVDAQLATITATTTIKPGERYYSQTGAFITARAPMTFKMGVAPAQGAMNDCQMAVCGFGNYSGPQDEWQLETLVTPTWTLTSPTGVSVTSAIPRAQPFPDSMTFSAMPTESSWQLRMNGANPLSDVMDSTGAATLQAHWSQTGQDTGFGFGRLRNPSDGVVLQIVAGGATVALTPITVPAAEAEVLWRFGVLLAVNDVARHIFPAMPVATTGERALAQSASYVRY